MIHFRNPSLFPLLIFLGATSWVEGQTAETGASSEEPKFSGTGEPLVLRLPTIRKWKTIHVPAALSTSEIVKGSSLKYGGDIRLGDLDGSGTAGFLVMRSEYSATEDGGMTPVFLGAFDQAGKRLWSVGSGGHQPARPAPFAIYDIDGDGQAEVIHFWKDPSVSAGATEMGDVSIQIRSAATGELEREATPASLPAVFRNQNGSGPNWVHQRILICNLRGLATPRDFIVKVGDRVFAFDETLKLLWNYEISHNKYPNHSAYIPAVGDIDGDGKDEVTGGRYLLDDDGSVLFDDTEGNFTPNMDSVAIAPWDKGNVRVLASGGGHVLDAGGKPVLALGKKVVPHGQEARIALFIPGSAEPQAVIRWNGHKTPALLVDTGGKILNRFALNSTPNETGMETLFWDGKTEAAFLYNGGMLWDPLAGLSRSFPDLPPLQGPFRMGWYHLIPADLDGDGREEAVLYNPWDEVVHIYGSYEAPPFPIKGISPNQRTYNVRLMD